MNNHPTKYKGDLTTARVMTDLIEKHWFVFQPVVSKHLAFDLLALKIVKDKPVYIRVQVKAAAQFRPDDQRGIRRYTSDTIDFYASYLADVSKCVYFPIHLTTKHTSVASKIPDSATPFWWYEDFLKPSYAVRIKRTVRDFNHKIKHENFNRLVKRKIDFPDPSNLQKLVWQMPLTDLGSKFKCSDVAVRKYAKTLRLVMPPQGFWMMKPKTQMIVRKECMQAIRDNLKRLS